MTLSDLRASQIETLLLRLGLLGLTVAIWRSAITLWNSGDFIRQPMSVGLALVMYVAAFAVIILATLKRVPSRALWAFPLGLALIFAATTQYEIVNKLQGGQMVSSDVFALTDYGANLTLMGKNPYAFDYGDYQYVYRMGKTFSTPLLSGNYISQSIDYPALSLLIPLPFLILHIPTQWIYPLFLALTLAAVFAGAPKIVRPIILLPLLIDSGYIYYAFSGVSDILWAFLVCMTLLLWRKRWQSAVWFGLACAAKQQPWLFAPFLLIRIWYETEGLPTRERLWQMGTFTGVTAIVFLAVNAPFIIGAPQAWLSGVLVPFTASMITLGQGLTSLTLQGIVNIPKSANTSYVLMIFIAGLFVYWRHYRAIRPVMWIIPSIAFWFGQRSLASYWYFNLIPLVLDLSRLSLDGEESVPRKAVRRAPALIVAGATLIMIAASLAWFALQPPSVLVKVQRPIQVQGVFVSDLTVEVTNKGHQDLNPRFSVQSWTEQPQFWRVESGPSTLPAGQSANYRIRASNNPTAFNYGYGAQVVVSDDADYSLRGSEVLKGDVEQNFLDGVPNGNFEYWDKDTPVSWGVITSGSRSATSMELTENSQTTHAARLTLSDATGSAYSSVMLDTWINLPTVPIELWIHPPEASNQPDTMNLVYGLEVRSTFNDQAVWVLFGDTATQGQITPDLPYVMLPAPRNTWSKQSVDIRGIFNLLDVKLAPPQWVGFHSEIDAPKQMVNFRLLLAAHNQPPGEIQAEFGPVHAAQYQAQPADVIQQSLQHPDYALVAHGDTVRRNFSFEEARQYYTQALAINPASAEARDGLAEIALHGGQWIEAASGFQSALDAGLAARAPALSGLAWARYQQGDYAGAETAIEDAVRALEQTPFLFDDVTRATTYARLGWIAYRQQRYALAQRAYQRSVEFDAANADAAFGQGLLALRSQDYYNAVRALKSGIQLGFTAPEQTLGQEIERLGRCADQEFYTQALSLTLPAQTCQAAS